MYLFRRIIISGFATNRTCIERKMSSTINKPNMNRFLGKVAIVTASTEGIGYAIAKRLGQEGASVVISSRKEANVKKATDELKSLGIKVSGLPCHVGDAKQRTTLIEHAIKEFGGVDILVSNAGINPVSGGILETTEPVWDKIFDINLKAGFLLTKEIVPHITKRGGGSILFVSSISGYQPIELLGAYSISKTALLGLTKVLSKELASSNIRVNCLAPGIIKTKLSGALHENPQIEEIIMAQIPLARFGVPDEIGGAAAFLCSDDAAYVTGESIVISGGMASRL